MQTSRGFQNEMALLIHGSLPADRSTFVLPPNVEIITFTQMGNELNNLEVKLITDCFRNNRYYNKYLVGANWGLLDNETSLGGVLENGNVSNFNIRVYNEHLEHPCPNLNLGFEPAQGVSYPALGFFYPGNGLLHRSNGFLLNNGIILELTNFLKAHTTGTDQAISLESLIGLLRIEMEEKPIRLFLFCCHVGTHPPYFMNIDRPPAGRITVDNGIIVESPLGEFVFTNKTTSGRFRLSNNNNGRNHGTRKRRRRSGRSRSRNGGGGV